MTILIKVRLYSRNIMTSFTLYYDFILILLQIHFHKITTLFS